MSAGDQYSGPHLFQQQFEAELSPQHILSFTPYIFSSFTILDNNVFYNYLIYSKTRLLKLYFDLVYTWISQTQGIECGEPA